MWAIVRRMLIAAFLCKVNLYSLDAAEKTAKESPRDIPVAYNVDVVVLGGSSAGVAAAVEAAKSGASVFVAAPRPYLGEDLCATYRLWLNPDEKPSDPFARDIFPPLPTWAGKQVPFTYTANMPSASPHPDSAPPSLLTDGRWNSAVKQSVQYNGDATIIADFGRKRRFRTVHVMVYQRPDDFEVASVALATSDDGQHWQPLATVENEYLGKGDFERPALMISAPVSGNSRYLRLAFKRGRTSRRILLGEILVEAADLGGAAPKAKGTRTTPMRVKRSLDRALIRAGIPFLFGCYATDVLRDREGNLAGVVMANRSGRQAVVAKVIIDATARASVARMAGAAFREYPSGPNTFTRVVVGGKPRTGQGIHARKLPLPIVDNLGNRQDAIEYTLSIDMADGSFASFARAEQIARDRTWSLGQVDASETLFQVPPDPVKGKMSVRGVWPGAARVDENAFRPSGIDRLYVLGGCADVSRDAAAHLLRPLAFLAVGKRIGRAAATDAKQIPRPKTAKLSGGKRGLTLAGNVRECLAGIRTRRASPAAVRSEARSIPVLASYDVVVVGGGTSGAPAGIAAARGGAKTLVVEYLNGLGGVGTLGLIGNYCQGYRKGFTQEVDRGLAALGRGLPKPKRGWNIELKMEWYRRQLRKAGADIWFGAMGCGAFVDGGRVRGVVVATPEGRGVVLAKVVIDSTGNADVAAAAGARCVYTDASHAAVQGTGLPPREPGANYTNTDYSFVDDSDVIDTWRAFVMATEKFKGAYDIGQLIDTRERHRIVGDYTLTPIDVANERKFPDTVAVGKAGSYDTHGYTVHPFFTLKAARGKQALKCLRGRLTSIPYRCLLPKGLDGILVTGLGISAHRDAMPVIRMQPDIQNQGYAAGVAASMAVAAGTGPRDIDVKALQKYLFKKGCLPEKALTDRDSFPLPQAVVAKAVRDVVNQYDEVAVILAQPREALPLLRAQYSRAADKEKKLLYAHVLAMIGDPTGAATLADAVDSRGWDQGWAWRGMGQFGASLSPLDSLIIALGRTRDKRAIEPVLRKLDALDAKSAFSHHRAVAVALESLRDPRAAKHLAALLKKPAMTGYAFADIEAAFSKTARYRNDNARRANSLRELILARALYRCGDYGGLGERILRQYAHDLRGHYARHAIAVLAQGRPPRHE